MTRLTFGATHSTDDVAAALAGLFGPEQLEHLAQQVARRRDRRRKRKKSGATLNQLHDVLAQACERARPKPVTGVLHVYGGDEMVAVRLADGTITKDIPQGMAFEVEYRAGEDYHLGFTPDEAEPALGLAEGDSVTTPLVREKQS